MNFNFGKKNSHKQNIIYPIENKELDDKLDNIYESIQNIVFKETQVNKLNSNKINKKIEPKMIVLENSQTNFNNKNVNFIKNKKYNKDNKIVNDKNNKRIPINDNSNFIKLKIENYYEVNNKKLNDNSSMKERNIDDNFSFRNNLNINKNNISDSIKINNNKLMIENEYNTIKIEENNNNKKLMDFCNIIKSNSRNMFKINNFEKHHSQKQILRLKLEAFLVLKKYYIHRKSKSAWIKKKRKLIKLADNFYKNLLLSRAFYGFVLNSKRKSLYNLIKNNYIDLRIKELSSFLIKILKFCYKEKKLENKAFFELTKNKLRRIIKEMKAQIVYNKTIDKYFFSQILNNDSAVEFSKILIYLGNSYNIKKLYRYESNINTIIHKEEFILKQKILLYLKNLNNFIENKLTEEAETFKHNIIIFNDKKTFINYLEERIILNYKIKYFQQKIFFLRSKYYLLYKKKRKETSPIFGPNKESILNFHNLKLKTLVFKSIQKNAKIFNQKIEELQIKNFMKNVKFFFYQSRKKTIESLIIEGMKQKINKYKKYMILKILLYSKIECLKQYRVELTTRKKYQKKFLFNILKKNVLLKNYEKLCNIKFFFRLSFSIMIKQKKKEKKENKLFIIQGMQKFFIHLVKLRIKVKKKQLNKLQLCKNKILAIRKKYFIKEIKSEIRKKKYNKLVYLKHDKLFSLAIGIINLKNKCLNGIKIKTKKVKMKITKKYYNIFKKRVIVNSKITSSFLLFNKYILKSNYKKFVGINNYNITIKKETILISNMYKTFYLKKYLEGLNMCYKMKLIDNKVDDYYKTKRKKIFLNVLKKRYQNSIKFSMLSLRFNEYLIISTFNSFFRTINKKKNENIHINFNDNEE